MARKNLQFINTKKAKGLSKFLSDKILLIKFVYAALFLSLINLIVVALMQKNLPPELPLFYGFTESDQQLTTPLGLLLPGTASFIVIILNSILSILIPNDFLKKTLSVTSLLISLLLLITVLKIIFLVGFF